MSWLCSCGLLNSGANKQCAASKQKQFPWAQSEHYQVSENTPDRIWATVVANEINMNSAEIRSILNSIRVLPEARLSEILLQMEESDNDASASERRLATQIQDEIKRRQVADAIISRKSEGGKQMTPEEERFAKFFHHEKILIKDMDYITLREHRKVIEEIVFEGRARLAADDEGLKDKSPRKKEWLITDTTPNVNVSDAINAVKQRAGRKSKMDRLREELRRTGIDEATINEMVGNLEKRATDGKLKTITFTGPNPSAPVKTIQIQQKEDSKPFDFNSLKFKCKVCSQNPCSCVT